VISMDIRSLCRYAAVALKLGLQHPFVRGALGRLIAPHLVATVSELSQASTKR